MNEWCENREMSHARFRSTRHSCTQRRPNTAATLRPTTRRDIAARCVGQGYSCGAVRSVGLESNDNTFIAPRGNFQVRFSSAVFSEVVVVKKSHAPSLHHRTSSAHEHSGKAFEVDEASPWHPLTWVSWCKAWMTCEQPRRRARCVARSFRFVLFPREFVVPSSIDPAV